MIFNTKNNEKVEFLNLQQQVQKNKEDIERHYEIDRSLANFGIRIVGVVSSTSELPGLTDFPQAANYQGKYGDAYAVGLEGDYTYYVYTRPDLNLGYANGYWLNVGKLFVQGPKGDPGVGLPGPQGASTRWYFGVSVPSIAAIEGDCYLITEGHAKGDLYGYKDGRWVYLMNIIGPQGNIGLRGSRGVPGESIVGPQGGRGLPGSVPIQIWGQVDSPTDLTNITPTQDNLSHAYLVGTKPPYHLWAIKQDTMVWIDLGEFVAVAGQDGGIGPSGMPGLDGNSIIYYDGVIQSQPLINTEYIYNPVLARTTTIIDDDLFIDKNANVFRVFSEEGRSCVFTGLNLRGPQGKPGKVEYEVFSISSVYQPDYGIYINLPTIYKDVEVLSIMISPPSGKYGHYYWDSKGEPKKIIQDGNFAVTYFPMIKGSDGTSVGKLTATTLNTNGVLNADGSKGMITISLKANNKWTGDALTTGQPTGIILVKCVR